MTTKTNDISRARLEIARRHRAAIRGNVDDWYADKIDYATFQIRSRALWEAVGDDVHLAVLALIRGDENDAEFCATYPLGERA